LSNESVNALSAGAEISFCSNATLIAETVTVDPSDDGAAVAVAAEGWPDGAGVTAGAGVGGANVQPGAELVHAAAVRAMAETARMSSERRMKTSGMSSVEC
jgi:hypothetical protein